MAYQTVKGDNNHQWTGKVNCGRMYYLDDSGRIWPDLDLERGWSFSDVDPDSPLLHIHNGAVTNAEFIAFKESCWDFLTSYGNIMKERGGTFPDFAACPGKDNFLIAGLHPWSGIPGLEGVQTLS
jgi:hypothetical protein